MKKAMINDERFETLIEDFRAFRDKEVSYYNEDGSWGIKVVESAEPIPEKEDAYTVTSTVNMTKDYGKVVVKRDLVFIGSFYLNQGKIMDLRKAVVAMDVCK